jgi:dipeptidase E
MTVKLLLTSGGVTNASIRTALLDLLGKPFEESSALAIPTAMYGHPWIKPDVIFKFIFGRDSETPMTRLGWQSVGVMELTALPSIERQRWESWVHDTDVFLVGGGDALYLTHWIRESGLFGLFPTLDDKVWC